MKELAYTHKRDQAEAQAERMASEPDYTNLLIDGKFRVQELEGSGSMSFVYRGLDLKGKTIAIKIMKQSLLTDADTVTRFDREIRTCMSLTHRNIVNVSASGKLQSGEPFLVMEFVHGSNLAELLKIEKSLPVSRALNIISQAADALEVAHSRGYIHRDIKPQNLMVCKRFPNQDHVKVLDFGVAKLFGSWHNLDKFATAPGNVLGTPLYMSPEQVLGSPLDGRSDIYSLGCVLYQCLCGVPPITGKSAVDVMQNHVAFIPKNLSDNGSVKFSEELNAIVQKSIAKKREDRYESMAEFAETLRKFIMPPLAFWVWSKYEEICHHKKQVSPALKSMSKRSKR